MNGNSVLVDTNIALYLLSGDKGLSDLLYNKKLYVSFITQLELLSYHGVTSKEQVEVEKFLEDCIIIDINSRIKQSVIKIRKIVKIKLPDSIILATSEYLGVPVISADGDFKNLETADVIFYEKE
ncbi:MAG TPA: PIN domain-containing protein [Cyclobacteriaceae bacterium]